MEESSLFLRLDNDVEEEVNPICSKDSFCSRFTLEIIFFLGAEILGTIKPASGRVAETGSDVDVHEKPLLLVDHSFSAFVSTALVSTANTFAPKGR